MAFSTLNENHKRSISVTLCLLDEMLCEFEEQARGRQWRSAFYEERNDLSRQQRKELLSVISRMRGVMEEVKKTLGLAMRVQGVSRGIWGRSMSFWENLVETQSRHLRRYGEMPDGFGAYLDPRMDDLIGHLNEIGRIAGRKLGVAGAPANDAPANGPSQEDTDEEPGKQA